MWTAQQVTALRKRVARALGLLWVGSTSSQATGPDVRPLRRGRIVVRPQRWGIKVGFLGTADLCQLDGNFAPRKRLQTLGANGYCRH